MRKTILSIAIILGASSIFAQDLTSKKGENYLPEAGDWAIGIDAVPLLDYIGNIFGKTADNNHAGNIWTPNNPSFAINGKYFYKDDLAFRGGIRLGFSTNSQTVMVGERGVAAPTTNPWPDITSEVANKRKSSNTNIGLSVGIEKRKGNTRLQGFYGGEFGFMISSGAEKYTYGNALTPSTATIPVTATAADDFGTNMGTTVDGQGISRTTRVLEDKSGMTFSLGLRAFIGAEYFIIPKLSIGGELGWGIGMSMNGKSKVTSETVGLRAGAADQSVETLTSEGNKSSSFGVDNSIVNPLFGPIGRLNLTFHF